MPDVRGLKLKQLTVYIRTFFAVRAYRLNIRNAQVIKDIVHNINNNAQCDFARFLNVLQRLVAFADFIADSERLPAKVQLCFFFTVRLGVLYVVFQLQPLFGQEGDDISEVLFCGLSR